MRDDGDLVYDPFFEVWVAFGSFLGGTATLTLFTPLTVVAGTPERLWIAYDISPAAVPGNFVGLAMVDATYVSVIPPDLVSCVGCPLDTYVPGTQTEIIPPPTDTLTITLTDLAPATAQQGEVNVLMAAMDLSVDANDAFLETITVDLTGLPPSDADVSLVTLWYDTGDLVFGPPDFVITTGIFVGGTATLNAFLVVTAGVDIRLWLTYDIAAGATAGDFVGAAVPDATAFVVSAPDVAVCTSCPFDTYVPGAQTEIVVATVDTLTFTPFDMAPATVQPGDIAHLMGGVDLSVDANSATVTDIGLDLTGLPPSDSDIGFVILWLDNGDLSYDVLVDPFVGVGNFMGGSVLWFLFTDIDVSASTPVRLWISFDIDSLATVGNFVGFTMVDSTYVTVAGPDSAVCSGCPMDTYVPGVKTEIVAPTADTLTFTPVDLAPATVQPGDTTVVMMAVDLSLDANAAMVTGMRIDLTGVPPLDSDVASVTLWVDDGDGLFEPTIDAGGPTGVFTGNVLIFTFSYPIFATDPERFWITFDIDAAAGLGNFVGVSMADATYVTVNPPDGTVCAGCPFDTYLPGLQTQIVSPTPDTLTVTPSDLAPPWVLLGATAVPVLQLNLTVDANTATLSSVTVDLTGTGTDADISAVELWRDNGDGFFNTGSGSDTQLDAASFVGGTAVLTAGVTVAAGTPEILFLAYDIAPAASPGAFVGAQVLDATYFNVLAPDSVVCTGCPLDTYVPGAKTEVVVPTLSATLTDVAPATARVGTIEVTLMEIALDVAYGPVDLLEVTGELTGLPPDPADVALVAVWWDDGDGVLDAGDSLLGNAPVTGTAFTVPSSLLVEPGIPALLFITYDIDPAATAGNWVGISLQGEANFTVTGGNVVCTGCPLDTYAPGLRTEIVEDTLEVTAFDLAPASAPQGASDVLFARLNLTAVPGDVTLLSVDVALTGTGGDADIAAVTLWQDEGDGTFDPATDALLAAEVFAGAAATLPANVLMAGGSNETLYIAYNLSATATGGAYIGVRVTPAFTVGGGDSVDCLNCPLDTYDPGVKTLIPATVGTIDGTAVDQASDPLSGVAVELLSGTTVVDSAISGAAGGFTFTDVTPGTYTVRGTLAGYLEDTATVTVAAGATETVTLQLEAITTGSISGAVTNTRGQIILGVTVQLVDDTGTVVDLTVTGVSGGFTFSDVDFGTYSLRVTAVGFQPKTVEDIVVSLADPDQDVGTIQLAAVSLAPEIPLWLIALLILVIIVVIAVVLLLMRRRKPAEEAPPEAPMETAPPVEEAPPEAPEAIEEEPAPEEPEG